MYIPECSLWRSKFSKCRTYLPLLLPRMCLKQSVLNRNADSSCSLGVASQRMQIFRKFDRLSRNTRRIHIFCKYSRCVIPCCEDIYTDSHAKYPSMLLDAAGSFGHGRFPACSRFRHRKNGSGSSLLLPKQFLSVFFYLVVMQHLLERNRDVLKNMSSTREINAKFVSEEMGWENEREHKGIRLAIKRQSM